MMEPLLEQLWKSLIGAGPLALVLGVAVYKLWQQNQVERDRHADEEERLRQQKDELRKEYVNTLKSLTKAMRDDGGSSHEVEE